MKRKFLSFFAIVLMIEITILAYAEEFMWNQDTVSGTYTTAEAYVSGYWYYPLGELLDTYAQVKGTINNALPDDGIVVMYRFQYDDYDSGTQYYFNGAIDESGG
ncbi:MAG: hypothetical protein QHH17_06710 [Candidatus Bathyarchaeota archaeon]|nr:hypothetical protein [Candidatus Bathyarchaeota archaeon]